MAALEVFRGKHNIVKDWAIEIATKMYDIYNESIRTKEEMMWVKYRYEQMKKQKRDKARMKQTKKLEANRKAAEAVIEKRRVNKEMFEQ